MILDDQTLLATVRSLVHVDTIVALVVGSVAGLVLQPIGRSAGIAAASLVVLALPLAALLEPAAGLALVAAMLATMIGDDLAASERLLARRAGLVIAGLLVATVALTIAHVPLAALLQGLPTQGRTVLLAVGAVAAALLIELPVSARSALAVLGVGVGIGLQLNPWPIASADSPNLVPALLGLLVVGPGLVSLVAARGPSARTPDAAIEPLITLLPAFLLGVPLTRGAALMTLNLADSGFNMGPDVIAQRPALVAGAIVATVVGIAVGEGAHAIAGKVGMPQWSPSPGAALARRLSALALIAAALFAGYESGLDGDGQPTGLGATTLVGAGTLVVAGTLLAAARLEATPIAVGLVFGRLMQATLSGGSP